MDILHSAATYYAKTVCVCMLGMDLRPRREGEIDMGFLQWLNKGPHDIYHTADCAFAIVPSLEHSVGPAGYEVFNTHSGWSCTFWHGNRGHTVCRGMKTAEEAKGAAQAHLDALAKDILTVSSTVWQQSIK